MTTPPNDDSELRRLLDDAVSDVHPTGRTADIRARARRTGSRGRWVPLTITAAVATVAVIAGTAWLGGRDLSDTPAAEPGGPGAPTSQPSSQETNPERTVRVPVYYVGDTAVGPRLFAETHAIEGVTGTDLDAAVQEALGGPPLDPDYTAWAPVDGLVAHTTSNGIMTIDLSEPLRRPTGMTAEAANMAVQALVWTVTTTAGEPGPVQFTVDGRPVDSVLGIETSSPVERASADSVLSTVSIGTPTEGSIVTTEFEVMGMAATFEANVVWELKQGDKVVRHGFTTAQECCTLSPYKFAVTAPPGDYTIVVHDTDESDGEGVGTSEDTKRITVE